MLGQYRVYMLYLCSPPLCHLYIACLTINENVLERSSPSTDHVSSTQMSFLAVNANKPLLEVLTPSAPEVDPAGSRLFSESRIGYRIANLPVIPDWNRIAIEIDMSSGYYNKSEMALFLQS